MKITEKIVNALTGEETFLERDETKEETKLRLEAEAQVVSKKAEAESKATAKAALLKRMGLTADEAALLLS